MTDQYVRILPRDQLTFTRVNGIAVPCQPWPQKFIIARSLLLTDSVELRPLTLTSLAKGVAQNFVTMNFWRLCWILRGLGFLKTQESCRYAWSDLTPAFWRYQQIRRFRWIRRAFRYRYEYVLRGGRVVGLPWIIWRWLAPARRRLVER